MIPKWSGHIVNNELVIDNESEYRQYLSTLKGELEIVVKKKSNRITKPELKYYYGVILRILAEEFGYMRNEYDQLDNALKRKFCEVKKEHGLEILPSKTEWSTVFTEAIFEEIRIWALTEHNITIPLPNQVEY